MTEQAPVPVVKQGAKQGAAIGGWICFLLAATVMYLSVWTFILYVPLFFVAFVLGIVAMAQRRIVAGLLLVLAILVAAPIQWLVLSGTRLNKFVQDHPAPILQSPIQPVENESGTAHPPAQRVRNDSTVTMVNAEQASVDRILEQSIADAHAWQIQVAHQRILVDNTTHWVRPVFSEDGQTVTYTRGKGDSVSIVTTTLRDHSVVDEWTPSQVPTSIAWSEDRKRLAYKTRNNGLHVVEWMDRKDIALPLAYKFGSDNSTLAWTGPEQLTCLDGGALWMLDLGSLEVKGFQLPDNRAKGGLSGGPGQALQKYNRLVGGPSRHSNWEVSADEIPGGESYRVYLFVKEKDGSYQHRLSKTGYNGVSGVAKFMYCVSPDCRHVLVSQGGSTWVDLVLGLREAPNMSFRIDLDLDKVIQDREVFDKWRRKGVAFWGNVYTPIMNPLNGKVVGPDRSAFKGTARISKWEKSHVIVTTFNEILPLAAGDIFTDFRSGADNGMYWCDKKTWLPLRLVTAGDAIGTDRPSDNDQTVSRTVELKPAAFSPPTDNGLVDAALKGDRRKVVDLLDSKAPIDAEDKDGDTALHAAATSGHLDIVEVLLSRGADVNHRDERGWTPLYFSVFQSHDDISRLLIRHGAEINAANPKTGASFLVEAIVMEKTEVVERLVALGADVQVKGEKGITPLFYAATKGNREIVELLLSKGASMEQIDGAVRAAEAAHHLDVANILKSHLKSKGSADTTEAEKPDPEAMFLKGQRFALGERAIGTPLDTETNTPVEAAVPGETTSARPVVEMDTTFGTIVIELSAEMAPLSVKNFLGYVDEKAYDGTIFHRVIKGFMIQGGGFEPGLHEKPSKAPIKNESQNGLKNRRGTIAMARTQSPDSATSQFFINHADNTALDYPSQGGYCVFGKVTEGMDVVDKIASVKTGRQSAFDNVPVDDVVIRSVRRR